jgi:hypothetical protein
VIRKVCELERGAGSVTNLASETIGQSDYFTLCGRLERQVGAQTSSLRNMVDRVSRLGEEASRMSQLTERM